MSDGVDAALFSEVRSDIRKLTDQMGRMNANFEHWSPIWGQQMNGLADLANRQTKHEMEANSLRNYVVDALAAMEKRMTEEKASVEKRMAEQRASMEKRMDDERAANEHLDKELAKAQEQRTITLRWIIGMGFTGVGIMLGVLTFLMNHVTFK